VLIPRLHQHTLVLPDNPLNLTQLMSAKTVIRSEDNRFQPELGLVGSSLDVYVRWFHPFVAEKEESVASHP
jgi:hypothetical protein